MNVHRTSLCFTYIMFLAEKILTWMYCQIRKTKKNILKLPRGTIFDSRVLLDNSIKLHVCIGI